MSHRLARPLTVFRCPVVDGQDPAGFVHPRPARRRDAAGLHDHILFWDTREGHRRLCRVDKAIYTVEQRRLSEMLRIARERAGLRQADVATALQMPQSFVSKYESGERRLDLIELKQVCDALGISLTRFVAAFEAAEDNEPPTESWPR